MRRFAVGSPRSIALARVTSSAAVSSLWRPTSARKSCRLSGGPEGTGVSAGPGSLLLFGFLFGLGGRLPHLEPDALELAGQLLDLVRVEVVLERERLELGGLEIAPLLGALDERFCLVGIK